MSDLSLRDEFGRQIRDESARAIYHWREEQASWDQGVRCRPCSNDLFRGRVLRARDRRPESYSAVASRKIRGEGVPDRLEVGSVEERNRAPETGLEDLRAVSSRVESYPGNDIRRHELAS